jgi:hypothetical protein
MEVGKFTHGREHKDGREIFWDLGISPLTSLINLIVP